MAEIAAGPRGVAVAPCIGGFNIFSTWNLSVVPPLDWGQHLGSLVDWFLPLSGITDIPAVSLDNVHPGRIHLDNQLPMTIWFLVCGDLLLQYGCWYYWSFPNCFGQAAIWLAGILCRVPVLLGSAFSLLFFLCSNSFPEADMVS